MHRLHVYLIIFVILGAALPAFSSQPAETLAVHMAERLAVMGHVAAYKRLHDLPVTDPPRERALLKELEGKAQALGLSPTFTRAFFQAQMEAAKQVQTERLAAWAHGEPVPITIPDLIHDIRPALDRLSASMLTVLQQIDAETEIAHAAATAAKHLHACGYSEAVIEAAIGNWSIIEQPSE